MKKLYKLNRVLVLCAAFLLSVYQVFATDLPTNNQRSIAEVLNPDGTLKKGIKGSFDAKGFFLGRSKSGAPVFSAAVTPGNEKWDNSPSNRIATTNVTSIVVKGTDVYAAGNGVFRWNGTKWDVIGEAIGIGVRALAFIGDDLYAGGSFTTIGGVAAKGVAKWNGTTWSSLGAGIDGQAVTFAVSGTNLYVGGYFTSAGGNTNIKHIARWTGSAWSGLGTGVDNTVNAIGVSGNDVYVGGVFNAAGGVSNTKYIARWNGTVWVAMGGALNSTVDAIAVSGSNVYVGGTFSTIGGQNIRGIARWNGSAWSGLGTGLVGGAKAIAISGTDIYIGGNFSTAGGVTVNRLAKWNGATWSGFGTGAEDNVNAIAVAGTDLYVGGEFDHINMAAGTSVFAKWNGTVWKGFTKGVWANIRAVAVSGTDVYIGGDFGSVEGLSNAMYIAKWDGVNWSALGTGLNNTVNAIAISGNDVYVGGNFTAADYNSAIKYFAKWNGSAWSAVGTGVAGNVHAIAVNGKNIYVGGVFNSAGGDNNAKNIAKWNGTEWSALGTGVDATVRAIAISGNKDVYVGGMFTNAGGIAANRIAKWDGNAWSSLGTGLDNTVNTIATLGNDVYVGGNFSSAGGNANLKNIAKWNGSAWSGLGTGVTGGVNTIAIVGTDVYVGGFFQSAGGTTGISNIAKWDGTNWSALGTGTNSTVTYIGAGGADLYIGGTFSLAGNNLTASFGIYRTGTILPPDHTNAFITTWDTGKMNTGNLIIPSEGTNYQYYWEKVGDEINTNSGAYQTNTGTLTLAQINAKTGIYKLYIKGSYTRIIMGNQRDNPALALTEVNQWGNISWLSMESAFAGCVNLTTIPAVAPDLSKVTTMYAMFNNARVFNQPIGHWDVSKVTNMSYLFAAARAFNQDISNWNVSKVTDMSRAFNGAFAFNQNISGWDVSKVTNMLYIFAGAAAFNQDVSSWNVSSASTLTGAFSGATAFNQNLGGWVLNSNANLSDMLNNSGLTPANYELTLKGWAEKANIPTLRNLGASNLKLTRTAKQYRDLLTKLVTENGKGWTITGDGLDHSNAFITIWDTNKMDAGTSLNVNIIGNGYEYYWERVNQTTTPNAENYIVGNGATNLNIPAIAAGTGVYRLYIQKGSGTFGAFNTYGFSASAKGLTGVQSWGTTEWTSMKQAFIGAENLNSLPASAPNLTSVTDMSWMLAGASLFNQSISHWDVSKITDMSHMLLSTTAFNQDLGAWNLSAITTMQNMLNGSKLSSANYGATLKGWAEGTNTPNNVVLGAVGLTYPANSVLYRNILTNNKSWTIDDSGVLPVSVSNFVAKINGEAVALTWRTTSEQNNNRFVISRSADNNSFVELTSVAGANNSATIKDYSYTDRKPLNGNNYYKLEQVDNDGTITLIGVKVVDYKLNTNVLIKVYPNPSLGEINITIPSGFGKKAVIGVIDMTGKTLHFESLVLSQETANYKLNNPQLPAGTYIISVKGDQKIDRIKVLVK